jgi:1,4-dihydroxy-2-naphthoate octaprenyltransferase
MKKILNYLGQFRLYSLIDLVLLMIAVKAGYQDFSGVILLHLGFIAYLETKHSHPYREALPKWLWVFLTVVGCLLYQHLEILSFLLCSYLYVKKTQNNWGYLGPLFRALQYFFIVAGIVGYSHPISIVVPLIIFIRNFAGDLRDVAKDIKEHIRTLPILMGFKNNVQHIHLGVMLTSSLIWFLYTNLPPFILVLIFILQIFTYRLTPR